MSAEDFDDYDDDFFENDDTLPPPPPTFEQRVADAARYGITVTVLAGGYPHWTASRVTCPKCSRTADVRFTRDEWRLPEVRRRLAATHPQALCEAIRREATAHVQWGLDYGGADTVQKQETEAHAREWAAECARDTADEFGYQGPVVVYREIGPWRIAPAPAEQADQPTTGPTPT